MCDREIPGKTAFMPEWSKGADLRSAGVSRVGSNPTECILCSCSSVG